MVVHTCNPVLRKLRLEDHDWEASLSYIARPGLKNKTKQQNQKYNDKVQITIGKNSKKFNPRQKARKIIKKNRNITTNRKSTLS
jgi:hypothetical protein